MGTKFDGTSVASYNASPPSDDGSTSDANKVKWSSIKTKLADPVKTAVESMSTELVTSLDQSCRAVTANDSAAAADHDRTIQVNTSSVTITLADAITMAAGYVVTVANHSSGNISIALATATDLIDTVTNATQTISAREARTYIVNAAANGYITKAWGRNEPISATLTDGATVSWNTAIAQVATLTLGGNRTMAAPTNLKVGTYVLHVIQDGTGSRTITWNSIFKWPLGVAPTLSTAASSRDVFSFVSDGTNLYGAMLKGMA